MKKARLAVDIGGTFTDTVLQYGGCGEEEIHGGAGSTGTFISVKTPTTPQDPVMGAMKGIGLVLKQSGLSAGDIGVFIHGTTLATNTLIEKKGATVATVLTEGFRDILEIGYERRYNQEDLFIQKPDLLVPRERCLTISERTTARGELLIPLTDTDLNQLVDSIRQVEAESVAICLLHAYVNPSHEQIIADHLNKHCGDISVSISSAVSPEAREFDRLSTTVANAYIRPLMSSYLNRLSSELNNSGMNCPLLIMTSAGGMTTLDTACRFPIRPVESGPSGGAILAARVARECDLDKVLSFDMGGTTAKFCLIDDGNPLTTRNFEIARAERFMKGSGMPVRIPAIELIEIGAGGGSIASVDHLQQIAIGPESQGSEPGPACFGLGGDLGTVTDADAVLGHLDPEQFADGQLNLNIAAAAQSMLTSVGNQLGLGVQETAHGISQMVGENMANAGRVHAAERGSALGSRSMIAFGGNGPLHATRVAQKMGVDEIIVPQNPGVGSAVGFLFAPVSFELVSSFYTRLEDFDLQGVNALLLNMSEQARQVVMNGVSEQDLGEHNQKEQNPEEQNPEERNPQKNENTQNEPGHGLLEMRIAFMRYAGQGHEIEVPLPNRPLTLEDMAELKSQYEDAYCLQFKRVVPGMKIEIMNWAVTISSPVSPPVSVSNEPDIPIVPAPSHSRPVYFGRDFDEQETGVYSRSVLRPGHYIQGPAIITEMQTSTLVEPGFVAWIDPGLNIRLKRNQEKVAQPDPGNHHSNEVRNKRDTIDLYPSSASAGNLSDIAQNAQAQFQSQADIKLQLMWSRLLAVVEEQGQALIRSAFSLIVRECGDISAGLFDVKGSMMAQAVTGTPGHINTMAEGVRNFIAAFPIDTMDPGDIYVTNDPWLAAGHLNDFMLVQPIFKHGHVIGFSSCTSHLVDVGGLCMGPQGSDIYDEGILIPPCCIVQSGQINELLFDIIKSNSRAPIENEGDLYALIACCEVGVDRLLEMLGDYQADDLQVLSHYIFEVSRKASREAIKRIPNGIYENTLLLDGYESEIVLKGKVTVNDEQIELDLEGSSPCSKYGINVPLNYAAAYSVFAIRCVVAAGVPNNGGSLEPFKVTAPENCIVNALHPTPVAMRHTVGQLLPDLVFGCLHQALPGQVSAEGASCMYDIPMRNAPNAADNQFAIELVHNGGTGARPQSDGLSATAYPSGVWGSQVEVTEATVPIHIARRELRIDSGGPGQFRGGLGQTIEFRSSIDAPFLLFLSLDRMHHPARGLQGGLPGAAGQVRVYSVGSQGRLLPGRGEVLVEPNESVIFESPGGGGFGSPQDRPKNAIETDVFQGLVSPEKAQTDYYLTCYLTKADKT